VVRFYCGGLLGDFAAALSEVFPMANVGDGQKHGWGNGALTPEDAERFAQMFRPSWELDDAPFAAASTDDTIADADMRHLERGGANAEVQATLAKGTLLMPPPSVDAGARSPAAAQRAAMNATMPLAQHAPGRAVAPSSASPPSRPLSQHAPGSNTRTGTSPTAAGARTRRESYVTDELLVPRKSKAGLIAAISVAALVAVGGIGALVLMSGSKPEAAPSTPADNPTVKVEARPVPPPPPAPEPPPPATAAPTKAAPPPAPEAPSTTAKPSPPPPPPPPVAAAPARPAPPSAPRNAGASAAPPKPRGGGSPIVHDVPF
jgi:hypothetical protein